MRRAIAGGLVLLLGVVAPLAAEPPGKVVRELYEAAYLEGGKVGFYHTTIREIERDGQTVLAANVELDLTIRRFSTLARVRMETGTEETPEGKVVGVSMKQYTDGAPVTITGRVDGKQLRVQIQNGRQFDKTVPWDDDVLGLVRQERFYQDNKVKPGDKLNFRSYEPTINAVVTMRATVKDYEEVDVLGDKRKLLRVEAVPDKVLGPKGEPVPLPKMTVWLGSDLQPVCSSVDVPGLAQLKLYRTTRAVALAKGTPPKNLDIGSSSLIRLNRGLGNAERTETVVYRITIEDDEPGTTFAQDARQSIKNQKGGTFDLHVKAVRTPKAVEKAETVGDEYRKSCYYINSEDAKVKEFARRAAGDESDPWRKAQRIERYVHQLVKLDNSAPFAPADQVAADPRGDCRHKAMLSAAMCRAAGVPSRTAVGLVYTNDRQRGPVLAFHMWAEVAIEGRWVAIDATQALGSVGADHVKIADHSWYDTQSVVFMLPVNRVLMGKVKIDVVDVEGGK